MTEAAMKGGRRAPAGGTPPAPDPTMPDLPGPQWPRGETTHSCAWGEEGKIFKAIPALIGELPDIGKDAENTHFKYKFRSIEAVVTAVKPLFTKHGIFCAPEVTEVLGREEREGQRGTAMLWTILRVRHTFYADDGSWVRVETVGEGQDSSDKSANKAMTAAFKYALMELFAVSSGEDTEHGGEDSRPSPRAASTRPPFRQTPAAAQPQPGQPSDLKAPAWWRVGQEFDAETTATNEKGEPVSARAVIRFDASETPTSGSKQKQWGTFEREPAWKSLDWLGVFRACIKTRLAGKIGPATDPIEWILSKEGCGAYGARGANWVGEQAAALDFMANQWLMNYAPENSPWRDTEHAKALGAEPRTGDAPAAAAPAQAAAEAARKAGAPIQTGAEAGLDPESRFKEAGLDLDDIPF